MKYNKQELEKNIAEMKAVYADPDTPEGIKHSIRPSLDKAEQLLKELEAAEKPKEKPTPAEIRKAVTKGRKKVRQAKTTLTVSQKKTLKGIVVANKKLQKQYAGYSESALRRDAERKAKQPGTRTSASGKKYREYRANRSDIYQGKPHLEKGGKISDWMGGSGYTNWDGPTSGEPGYFDEGGEIENDFNEPENMERFGYKPDLEKDSSITDNPGTGYEVAFAGKFIGETEDMEEALAMIKAEEAKSNFYPNIWFVSDHGNSWLIDREGNEIKFSHGGRIATNLKWQTIGLSHAPDNFTPGAASAFVRAITELENDKENLPFYNQAKAALAKMAQIVNTLLRTSDPVTISELLQELGAYNYKTGLLLSTGWLNNELVERQLKKGGKIGKRVESRPADQTVAVKRVAGMKGAGPKMATGGRLKSGLMRDRAYKSKQPHEQRYKRRTRPANPKYKRKKGGPVTFDKKVSSISKSLEGTKVPDKYKRDYGKKYNKGEAKLAARRIAGAMRKKEKMKK